MSRHPFGWSLPPGVTDRMIDDAAGGDQGDEYGSGYDDGWKHGYESALHDAEQAILAKQRTIQAYGNMDCEVIHIDEAMDALAELRKAKS